MAKKEIKSTLPTDADISKFQMLEKLIASIYEEMKEFAKKKPDELLNKFKVKNINRVLSQIKEIMKLEPTDEFLDLLDEDTLPSNSDCIIIIGQYKAAIAQYKSQYYIYSEPQFTKVWHTKEHPNGQPKEMSR